MLGGEERFTKNSVIGRVHRMGLAVHGHKPPKADDGVVVVRKKVPRKRPQRAPGAEFQAEAPTLPPMRKSRPGPSVRRYRGPVRLLDLPFAGACKWPVGIDPRKVGKHLFCARHVPDGGIYCAEHMARMYQQGRR